MRLGLSAALFVSLVASAASAQFSYRPAGELVTGSGTGRVDSTIYAPGLRFPIEVAPAYANSQVWGVGGNSGPSGSQCDTRNYSFPWYDNYCETRTWTMPMCPSGTGHQGQDIRPSTCANDTHWAVAVVDGTITNVGSYSVYLTAADGTRYDYLHMRSVQVAVGDVVTRGERMGRVSNNFGTSSTTIHLHFNIRKNISGYGSVYAPTYMSLIRAYESLTGVPVPSARAQFVAQSFPYASQGAASIPQGGSIDAWIDLKNAGTTSWDSNTRLAFTMPNDRSFPELADAAWIAANRVVAVTGTVTPGSTHRFAFRLDGNTVGLHDVHFGVVQEGSGYLPILNRGGTAETDLEGLFDVVADPDAGTAIDAAVDDAGDGDASLDLDAEIDPGDGIVPQPSSDGCGRCAASASPASAPPSLPALVIALLLVRRRRSGDDRRAAVGPLQRERVKRAAGSSPRSGRTTPRSV